MSGAVGADPATQEPASAPAAQRAPDVPVSTDVATDLDTAAYCLRLGDDALVLGQRLCEWAARSPQLEEDVALLNIALDLLGSARTLLTRAGELEGRGRSEDDLAFLRDEPDFSCGLLFEAEGGDFGRTMARQLLMSAYQVPLWEVFVRSKRGLSHTHVGSLRASDAHMALRNARDVYTRRQEGVSLWGVRANDIVASSPDEKDPFVDPAADTVYRHPTFYDVPADVPHM